MLQNLIYSIINTEFGTTQQILRVKEKQDVTTENILSEMRFLASFLRFKMAFKI